MVSGWIFIVFSCSYLVCIFLFFLRRASKLATQTESEKAPTSTQEAFPKKMEFNNARPCPTLKKKVYRTEWVPNVLIPRSQCHAAAAEGAKLSKMRRGRAQPCHQRRARPIITLCQRHANALPRKKSNAVLHAQLIAFFFPWSALHTLTPCLKG